MRRAAAAALLVGLTLLVYAGASRATFVWDDRALILNNARVTEPHPVWSYWTSPTLIAGHWLRGFRPLTLASFAWNYHVAGPSRAVFHLTSVAVHCATVVGLWFLGRRVAGWRAPENQRAVDRAALWAAALFAVHPAMSQAVLFLTARSTLIAASGIVWAAVCYDISLTLFSQGGPGRWGWYAAALACWGLALSGKESAIAGAALFLGLEWGRRVDGGETPNKRMPLVRLGLAALVGLAYLLWVFRMVQAQATTPAARSWTANLVGQCAAAWEYARLLVWPTGLALDHAAEAYATGWSAAATLGSGLLVLLLLVAWRCRNHRPAMTVGLLTAVVVIGPESYALPLKILVNEHRLYLPGACLALALGVAILPALARRPGRTGGLAGLVIGLAAFVTVDRVRVWESAERLWADAWRTYPQSCRAPAHLGQLALDAGRVPRAVEYLEQAAACEPMRLEPRLLLLQAYSRAGRHAEALAVGQGVLQAFPLASSAHAALGTALATAGRVEEAVPHWRRALELDPRNREARANLERAGSPDFDT